ncbi:hypothetical protein Q1695_001387 [Nippostrongylus brasiliensis]|nr:hypothetical protein Q1695_001387 [Nippostrongylus brasiliensis]
MRRNLFKRHNSSSYSARSVRNDSKLYCEILENCYLPYEQSMFNGRSRLVQDNAPAWKSLYTKGKLNEWDIDTLQPC